MKVNEIIVLFIYCIYFICNKFDIVKKFFIIWSMIINNYFIYNIIFLCLKLLIIFIYKIIKWGIFFWWEKVCNKINFIYFLIFLKCFNFFLVSLGNNEVSYVFSNLLVIGRVKYLNIVNRFIFCLLL